MLVFSVYHFTKQHVLAWMAGVSSPQSMLLFWDQKTKLWHFMNGFGTKIEKKINSYTKVSSDEEQKKDHI